MSRALVGLGMPERRLSALRRLSIVGLWLALLAALITFLPALFSQESLYTAPLWTKLIKDVPVAVLLAVCGLYVFSIGPATRRFHGALNMIRGDTRRFALCLLALYLFMLASALLISSPTLGYLVSVRYYAVYPLLALGLAYIPFSGREFHRWGLGIVLLALLETVIAGLEFFGAFGDTYYAGSVNIAGYLFPRPVATLGNPNNLGMFLGLGLIVALVLAQHGYLRSWMRWSIPGVLVGGVVLTFSKAATLAMAGTIAFAVLRRSGERRFALAAATIAAGTGIAVLLATRRLGGTSPFGTRFDSASDAIERWIETPRSTIAGHGFAEHSDVDPGGEITETVVDNMALALAAEGGIVTVLLFSALVFFSTRALFRQRKQSVLGSVTQLYAIFFLSYTAFAVNFRLFPGALFFWILVGMCLSEGRQTDHDLRTRDPSEADFVREPHTTELSI